MLYLPGVRYFLEMNKKEYHVLMRTKSYFTNMLNLNDRRHLIKQRSAYNCKSLGL